MNRLLNAVLAVALAAAGCATEAPGRPVPDTDDPSAAPPTSSSPSGVAPPINSPALDLAGYESRVCDLLAPAQLTQFAVRGPGKRMDGAAGPACSWYPPDTTAGASVTVAILSKAKDGWEGIYERRDKFPFFEQAEDIGGYPAVHLGATTIDTSSGTCASVVGVNPDVVFETSVDVNVRSSPEYADPCSQSDKVASLVIDTLKGGR